MSLLNNTSEGFYWKLVMTTVALILLPLIIPIPWSGLFNDDQMAFLFLLGMLLVGLAVIFHLRKSGRSFFTKVAVLGLMAVLYMFLLRLTMAERSHLIEYSVLTLFIYRALTERKKSRPVPQIYLQSFWLSFGISLVDEGMQLFIPHRVFNTDDILFNAMAVAGCLFFIWFIPLLRQKLSRNGKK